MRTLKEFLNESLGNFSIEQIPINESGKYSPRNTEELVKLIRKLINERGLEADLNDIDVSNITDMYWLFTRQNNLDRFNGDISSWDVSNVKNMSRMFDSSKFNGDISKWDVSKVEDMVGMFAYSEFDGNIDSWDVDHVRDMDFIFVQCPLEKHPPKWYKK